MYVIALFIDCVVVGDGVDAAWVDVVGWPC